MSEVLALLAELFLIGCLHIIMNLLIDAEKNPVFSSLASIACYAGSLFIIVRFVVANLLPQMAQIFRVVL
ncbi:MAG: hypothetical protein LBE55_03655 [Clostridiales bacterium]|jgi:hypothetical protein|nr:hypothetical protein [Clostridiales bacterium]